MTTRRYIPAAQRKKLKAFFAKWDRHFWGIRAGEETARKHATNEGLYDLTQGHKLTRLAHRYCKFWRHKGVKLHPRPRRTCFDKKEWTAIEKELRRLKESDDSTHTVAFYFMHLRVKRIPCSKWATVEGLKVAGIPIRELPG